MLTPTDCIQIQGGDDTPGILHEKTAAAQLQDQSKSIIGTRFSQSCRNLIEGLSRSNPAFSAGAGREWPERGLA